MSSDQSIHEFAKNAGLARAFQDLERDERIVTNILNNDIAVDSTAVVDELLLQEFRKKVNDWMELDNQIKRLEAAASERRKKKGTLQDDIRQFMAQYNLEDLNTKAGIIRYKKVLVKEGLSQKKIREQLHSIFKDDPATLERVDKIFTDRAKIETERLQRLKLK
jgi:DNA polymerase III delta prime subunit